MSGFMGPGKSSSLVTTLLNRTPCFKVVLWRENEVAQDDGWVGWSLGTKISSQEQGPNFDLVGTSRKVVVCETWEATCTMCCRVLPLQSVYWFESPWHSQIWVDACSLLSSHSLHLMYLMDGLEDGYGYYCITLRMTLPTLLMYWFPCML
jgi:hypothetical protein